MKQYSNSTSSAIGEASASANSALIKAHGRDKLAAGLASAGFRVFPLAPNTKMPAFKGQDWRKLATKDPERVRRFYSEALSDAPLDFNIGIATGDGLVVIDVDNKDGKQGSAALERWELRHGDLPETFTVGTASGGEHLYFRLSPGVYVPNSVGKLGEGLDVRGDGGYVVGPWSGIDGRLYEVRKSLPIAAAPANLVKLVSAPRPAERTTAPAIDLDLPEAIAAATKWLQRHAELAVEGAGGDTTTIKVANRVLDHGLSIDAALDLMLDHWNERCAPPWDPDELRRKVENAERYRQSPVGASSPELEFDDVSDEVSAEAVTTGDPAEAWPAPDDVWSDRRSAPAPDLEPGILPAMIDAWVTDEADRKGVDRGALATPAMPTFAGAISARNTIQVKQHDTGHTDRPVLWGALIGGPGSGKSPTIAAAVAPLTRIDNKRKAEFARQLDAFTRADAARKARKNAEGPPPDRPRNRSRIIQDVTTESALQREAESGNGCVLLHDELSAFAGSMDAYHANKSGISRDSAFWLSAKQGAPYEKDRVSTGGLRVSCHAVSIIGGIQPDVIRKLGRDWSGNGMMQRMLLHNMGPKRESQDRTPDAAAAARVNDIVERLYVLEPNDFTPIFRFAPEADACRKSVTAFAREQITAHDTSTPLQGWLDKLEGEWARIALVFHWIEWAGSPRGEIDDWPPDVIGAETARRAERFLLEYQWPQQRYFYTEVLGSTSSARDEARQIAGYVLSRELSALTDRQAQQAFRRMAEDERAAGMQALVEAGWLRPAGTGRRGQPNQWAVNPQVHELFAARAFAEAKRRADAQASIAKAAAERSGGAS